MTFTATCWVFDETNPRGQIISQVNAMTYNMRIRQHAGETNSKPSLKVLLYLLRAVFLGRCHMLTWGLCRPSWCTGTQCGYQESGTCSTARVNKTQRMNGLHRSFTSKAATHTLQTVLTAWSCWMQCCRTADGGKSGAGPSWSWKSTHTSVI